LIFDFCFHYSKLRHESDALNDVPVMIVCEEAHNYIPQKDDAAYRSSRKSLERVAKEGRKYGLSLMVVSQTPVRSLRDDFRAVQQLPGAPAHEQRRSKLREEAIPGQFKRDYRHSS